jgi:DHA2 family multidrug resistance protein
VASDGKGDNRRLITLGIILSTFMSAIDTTVANIALPHMQGSLSASPEQITWVITSYIVATAVTIPVSGWLAAKFGIKPMLLASITAFAAASILCGLATSLPQLVLFRMLQGMAAAPMMPLTQTVLFNINPPERYGRAMALFTMAAVVAPAVGPIFGGYLTEDFSWRWCFFINVPVGIISLLLITTFLPGDTPEPRRFDFLGFGSLAIAIAAFQLVLDRGTTLDWFSSREIWVEATVAGTAFWVFCAHSLTTAQPLFPSGLLRDRNFVTSIVFGFFFSVLTFSSFTLLPLMMQGLLGYSVIHAGVLSMPRGIVMLLILQVMGRIDAIVDRRLLVTAGLACFVTAFWLMSRFSLDMSGEPIVWASMMQGVGQGILFVPLSTLGFATISQKLRPDASALSNLIRNVGGSIGVATMQALTAINTQTMHASLAAHVDAVGAVVADLSSPGGVLALDGEIARQALMVAYVDDFWLMTILGSLCIPLVLLMRQPRRLSTRPEDVVVEV